jgi:hypothetical protein
MFPDGFCEGLDVAAMKGQFENMTNSHKLLKFPMNRSRNPAALTMSVENELDRLKFEASDERKKAVYSTTSKRDERQERISVLQRSLEERIKARDQVKEKARRLLEMVRGDPRLGSSNVSEERLATVLEANPAMRRVQAEMLTIQDELATLQREGLCRLVPRSSGGVEADQHPLRTGGSNSEGRRAAVSAAAAARRFLSDAELREVEGLVAAAQGADGARIRRAAAALLRDFAQTILEVASEPVSASKGHPSITLMADPPGSCQGDA